MVYSLTPNHMTFFFHSPSLLFFILQFYEFFLFSCSSRSLHWSVSYFTSIFPLILLFVQFVIQFLSIVIKSENCPQKCVDSFNLQLLDHYTSLYSLKKKRKTSCFDVYVLVQLAHFKQLVAPFHVQTYSATFTKQTQRRQRFHFPWQLRC